MAPKKSRTPKEPVAAAEPIAPKTATQLEVFVGTYDNYLFGYRVAQTAEHTTHFERFIGQPTHTASIRTICARRHFLATGAGDDRISVVDLRTNQEIQLLTHHSGTVARVAFTPDGSHLFSCAADGQLAATKTGSWQTAHVWRTPHSGKAIVSLAVHPSGKLALTIGKDGTLRTWCLIKGRQCFTTNLRTLCERGETIEEVVWSPAGGRFALLAVDRVLVMAVGGAKVERELVGKGKKRATSLVWLSEGRLLVGQEGGRVRFVDVEEAAEGGDGVEAVEVEVHENRVKDMALMHGHLVTMTCTSTAGCISLWQLDADACTLTKLCTTALNRRPICLAVADSSVYRQPVPVKPEQADDGEDADDDVVPPAAVPAARKIVSLGRVTIETEGGDDEAEEANAAALVSVLQTPKAKKANKSKKRAAKAVDDDVEDADADDVETPTTPPPSKKAKKPKNPTPVAAVVEPKHPTKANGKRKSSASSGFVETPVVVAASEAAKSKKGKKPKKLNSSVTAPEPAAASKTEQSGKRRKSSKF